MAEADAGVGSGLVGMLNVFVDPASTVKRIPAKLFWLWPVITLCIIYVVFGYLMIPYAIQMIDARMSQQFSQAGNVPPERIETARRVAHTIGQVSFVATPAFIIGFVALLAWLVGVTGSMLGVRAKFRDVFSLMAACALIPALQYIATYIVLRVKDEEVHSQDQMTPPFGVDIFLPDVHGVLGTVLNFFSIFEIWYLVILVFGLSYLAKCSKGQAFAAITPAWLLPLAFRMVGAMFGGSTNS
jgi:hypothetical protein